MASQGVNANPSLADIYNLLRQVNGKVDLIVADLTALNAAVDDLASEETGVVAELQRLSALVASGGTVSQADLDALTARIVGVTDGLKAAVAADPPAEAAPAQ